jgi:hypothetical protein
MDRTVGGRPTRFGREMRAACGDQVAMPAQHGLGADQESDPAQHVAGESV